MNTWYPPTEAIDVDTSENPFIRIKPVIVKQFFRSFLHLSFLPLHGSAMVSLYWLFTLVSFPVLNFFAKGNLQAAYISPSRNNSFHLMHSIAFNHGYLLIPSQKIAA